MPASTTVITVPTPTTSTTLLLTSTPVPAAPVAVADTLLPAATQSPVQPTCASVQPSVSASAPVVRLLRLVCRSRRLLFSLRQLLNLHPWMVHLRRRLRTWLLLLPIAQPRRRILPRRRLPRRLWVPRLALDHFSRVAKVNAWSTDIELLQHLTLALEDPAAEVLRDFDDSSPSALDDLWKRLNHPFGHVDEASEAMRRFDSRRQSDTESLVEYETALRILYKEAWPDASSDQRDAARRRRFEDGGSSVECTTTSPQPRFCTNC